MVFNIRQGRVGQAATFVVAASDSLHPEHANYICDGGDDHKEIQAAIDALPDEGGKIALLEGNYYIGSPINLYRNIPTWFNIFVDGMGLKSTEIHLQNNSNCNMIENVVTDNDSGWKGVSNMSLHGNKTNQTSGSGIYCGTTAAGNQFDMRYHNIFVEHCKEFGMHLNHTWGTYVTNCVTEFMGGTGFSLSGAESFVYGLHSSANDGSGAVIKGSEIHASDLRISDVGKHGLEVTNSTYNTYNNIFISDWGQEAGWGYNGLHVRDTTGTSLYNNVFSNFTMNGVGTSNTYQGVFVEGRNNVFNALTIKGILYTSVGLRSASLNNIVSACQLEEGTDGAILDQGTGNIWSNKYSDLLMDVLAVSATHVRSNEDLSAAIPNTFTLDAQPDIPRTLSWAFDSHAQITAYDMEVIGIDAKGNSVTETWDETAGWTGETTNAFAIITSIKMTSRTGTGAGDTMDIGITDVLGLSNRIYTTGDVFKIKKNNANATVATAQVNAAYGTYDMGVLGLAATDDFTIWYKSNLNVIS